MISPAGGSLLAQTAPSGTSAVAGLTPSGNARLEVMRILVTAGTTGATMTIYHDEGGSTYAAGNRIFVTAIAANTTFEWEAQCIGGGIHMAPADTLGVQTSLANELTFTFYGVVQQPTQQVQR